MCSFFWGLAVNLSLIIYYVYKSSKCRSEIAQTHLRFSYSPILYFTKITFSHGLARGETGGLDPLKNHTNIGFLSNTGPDPLKNHKASNPAFNVGPSSARWWRMMALFSAIWILSPPIKNKHFDESSTPSS